MAGAVNLSPGLSSRRSQSRALTVVPAAPAADNAPSRWLRLKPPRLAIVLTVAALALHALVLRDAVPWAQSVPLGITSMLAGFGWVAWASWSLRRAGTALASLATPTVLVDEGPYRFHRHPVYFGIVVVMLGLGVTAGVPLMLVAAANFVAIVSTVHIPHEEARLQHAFGGWYSDYAASVRRWMP